MTDTDIIRDTLSGLVERPNTFQAQHANRGLAALNRIAAQATIDQEHLTRVVAKKAIIAEALTRVLEWPQPPQGGHQETVETWAIPGWLAREARRALKETQ